MRVAHIVPYIGDLASGPAYSVPALCSALQKKGCDITLFTLKPLPNRPFIFRIQGYKWHRFWPIERFGLSIKMYNDLLKHSDKIDIIHNHSFWMAPNIYAGIISKRKNIPLISSPRGTLSDVALKRSKWKKKIARYLGQNLAFNQTSMFHTTAKHETYDVKKYFPKKPVIEIPNGIDIPEIFHCKKNINSKKMLFLGRLHPIKGIENLIDAWSLLENSYLDWSIDIVGTGTIDYENKLKLRIRKLKLKNIKILPPVYGKNKNLAYQNANIYILPSYSENFGMTVAEALSNNTPVITTNQTPWKDLNKMNSGWCIEVGVDPLKNLLNKVLNKSNVELSEMGLNGRLWMEKEFSWNKIADDMILSYKKLLKNK